MLLFSGRVCCSLPLGVEAAISCAGDKFRSSCSSSVADEGVTELLFK